MESLNKVIALTTQNKLPLVEAQHDVYDTARLCVGRYGVSGLRHIPDLTAESLAAQSLLRVNLAIQSASQEPHVNSLQIRTIGTTDYYPVTRTCNKKNNLLYVFHLPFIKRIISETFFYYLQTCFDCLCFEGRTNVCPIQYTFPYDCSHVMIQIKRNRFLSI